jgi:hypothetical protein
VALLCFDLEQLSLVSQTLARSETLVSSGFRIPALPSKHYPYELVTLVDLQGPERADHAFAHLVVYERPRATGPEPLYRICLQDDIILGRTAGAGREWLEALLGYVLTHELVHVVRFQRAEQSFHAADAAREREEDQVHQLTLGLLRAARDPYVERLDELYGNPVIPASRVR